MGRVNHRTGPRLPPRSLLLLLLGVAGCAHQPAAGGAKAPPAAVKVELVTPAALIPLTLHQARFEAWDWDGNLESRYIYKDIKVNTGLSADDFTAQANGL